MKEERDGLVLPIEASLQEIETRAVPLDWMHWAKDQVDLYEEKLQNPAYFGVFTGKTSAGERFTAAGAGRLMGFRVWVSQQGVRGELDLNGKTVAEDWEREGAPFTTMPFSSLFACCRRLYDRVKDILPTDYASVPWLGGVKSLFLEKEEQLAADFYLPEQEVFGTSARTMLFTAGTLPREIILQGRDKDARVRGKAKTIAYSPDKKTYVQRLEKVLECLKNKEIDKIILARRCEIESRGNLDWQQYASHLYDTYYQEYFYTFRQGDDSIWCGISPSILFKQHGGIAECRVLAGSRKHYASEEMNARMRQELSVDPKDIEEHECALSHVLEQWQKANMGTVQIARRREVMETPYAFHLLSQVEVSLNKEASCFDCMGTLYPSPSVWGIPEDKAESIIKHTETFDREYYGGVYGWFNFQGNADFAIVIRSAKVQGNRLSVFGGGGIIAASQPEGEYDETVGKMYPLVSWFSNVSKEGTLLPDEM